MKSSIFAITVSMLVIGGTVSCSSSPAPVQRKRGTLPPATAQITIDGDDAGTSRSVECAAVLGLTTIRTGDNDTGATIAVSNAERTTVDFVRIRNLNGFSGDYNLGLGGDASAALTDATYHITGTAFGYSPKSIEPTTHSFTIEVAC